MIGATSASSRSGEKLAHELGGREARSQARPDDEGVVLVVQDAGHRGFRVDLLDVVLGQRHRRRLDDLRREQRLERFGDGQRHKAGTGPAGRTAHEEGSAGVVQRAGDDEQPTERALVAACRSLGEERGDDVVIEAGGTRGERRLAC